MLQNDLNAFTNLTADVTSSQTHEVVIVLFPNLNPQTVSAMLLTF